jgi:hypothetical protein
VIHFVMTGIKRGVMEDFLAFEGQGLASRMTLVTWEELAGTTELPPGTWVLADLDGLGPAGMKLASSAHRALSGARLPTLNHPGRTLLRFELIETLHREGINGFRAARATDDLRPLRSPVFVRGASDHYGSIGDLLYSPEEVRHLLERAESAGLALADLMVVEFQDTARADGLYNKYGAFVVGDRVCPQHYLRGKPWMIKHNQSEFTEEIVEEEYRYVKDNPHEDALRDVFRLAGIGYGRVDYSVDRDGALRIWEINLCPIVGETRTSTARSSPPHLRPLRQRAKDIFQEEITKAFEAVDEEAPADPERSAPSRASGVALDVPPEIRSGVIAELAPKTGGEGLLQLIRAKTFFGRRW